MRQFSLPVLTLSFFQTIAYSTEAKSASGDVSVSLAIASVLRDKATGDSKGVAMLRLDNGSDFPVEYPLTCRHGKGSMSRVPPPLYKRYDGSAAWMIGAEFAEVRYEWRDAIDRLRLTGVHDVSMDPGAPTVESGQVLMIHVPIDLPSEPGRYVLSVQLDNRALSQCFFSSNYIRPVRRCFQLREADAAIVIVEHESR